MAVNRPKMMLGAMLFAASLVLMLTAGQWPEHPVQMMSGWVVLTVAAKLMADAFPETWGM